jgi:hypothetical protein
MTKVFGNKGERDFRGYMKIEVHSIGRFRMLVPEDFLSLIIYFRPRWARFFCNSFPSASHDLSLWYAAASQLQNLKPLKSAFFGTRGDRYVETGPVWCSITLLIKSLSSLICGIYIARHLPIVSRISCFLVLSLESSHIYHTESRIWRYFPWSWGWKSPLFDKLGDPGCSGHLQEFWTWCSFYTFNQDAPFR